LKIPWQSLSDDTLDAVIEEFVTREGTDYGHAHYSLEEKITQVKSQLRSNRAYIGFDEETETVSLQMTED
jgi:uncharacterized protein YheU (UPF0270 family)